MTVCIAAICKEGIVTASDRLLTWSYSASETALKASRIAPRWMTMIAGDDISHVDVVIRNARETLKELGDNPSTHQVQAAIFAAWRDAQNMVAEAKVLNHFRLTVPDFVKCGRQSFGAAKFADLVEKVEAASHLGCQLLVCGLHQINVPSLFVTDDGVLHEATRSDYAAIGSGHMAALASLSIDGYNRQSDMTTAIYHVCAAKFMAEASRAPGVGKDTIVLCMRDDGKTKWLFKSAIAPIRDLWEKEGRPRVPAQGVADGVIGPILKQLQWTDV